VRMPFEVLMEHVAALTGEDKELPMGKLSERWGEPASRIADAIDAVRVMNGERTYVTVDAPREKGGYSPPPRVWDLGSLPNAPDWPPPGSAANKRMAP